MSAARSSISASLGLVTLAVGYQWLYNGANFVAFKVGGDTMPPIILATLRFGIDALLLLPLASWRFRTAPATVAELCAAAALGTLMLVGSQTLAILGAHLLPAGTASVFSSATPLFLALFAWAALRQPLGTRQLSGVGVGFTGLVAMGVATADHAGFSIGGAALTLLASATWAAGSLLAPRLCLPTDPIIGLATQLAAAAVLLLGVDLPGWAGSFDPTTVSTAGWTALAFLVGASTLIGYAVFLWLNRAVSSTLANTFNYASPVVALLLSAAMLGERLTWFKAGAAGIVLAGVALMLQPSSNPPGPEWRRRRLEFQYSRA